MAFDRKNLASFFDDNPVYRAYDHFSPFADSRDGEYGFLNDGVAESVPAGSHLSARTADMPAIGNIIDNERLVPFSQRLTEGQTPEEQRRVPKAVYNAGIYADMVQMAYPLALGQEALVLPRNKTTRVFLMIVNPGISPLYVSFDQVASANGLPIPAGGNFLADASVPQNDIHILYGGATGLTVPIFFMLADLSSNVP